MEVVDFKVDCEHAKKRQFGFWTAEAFDDVFNMRTWVTMNLSKGEWSLSVFEITIL